MSNHNVDPVRTTELRVEVDVHFFQLSFHLNDEKAIGLMSSKEIDRLGKLQLKDQDRFKKSRSLLRLLISEYTGIRPSELVFRFGVHGKLYLNLKGQFLYFSLTHTDDLFGVAISNNELGVDVERVGRVKWPVLADTASVLEKNRIQEIPDYLHNVFATKIWVAKEACAKAFGFGIPFGLDKIQIRIDPEGEYEQVNLQGGEKCRVCTLKSGLGYVGALAIRDQPQESDIRLEIFEWNTSSFLHHAANLL